MLIFTQSGKDRAAPLGEKQQEKRKGKILVSTIWEEMLGLFQADAFDWLTQGTLRVRQKPAVSPSNHIHLKPYLNHY